MAKVNLNQLMRALSGQIGGLVFRQLADGSVVASLAPDFSWRTFSQGQINQQQRFRKAAAYATVAAKAQPIYADLAHGTRKTAYNIAVSDWFRAPVVHQVQQNNGRILVQASDNILVAKVVVTVLDEQGTVLEKGEAVRGDGNWWEYAPRAMGKKVIVEAWDLAANVTKFVRAQS